MANILTILALSALAGVAIERSIRAGRWREKSAIAHIRMRGYAHSVEMLKGEWERYRAASASAMRAAEVALEHGDARAALDALASVPPDAGRRLSDRTDPMLAEDAATAIAAARESGELRTRRGMLGRLVRGANGQVGDSRADMDAASRGMPPSQGGVNARLGK